VATGYIACPAAAVALSKGASRGQGGKRAPRMRAACGACAEIRCGQVACRAIFWGQLQ